MVKGCPFSRPKSKPQGRESTTFQRSASYGKSSRPELTCYSQGSSGPRIVEPKDVSERGPREIPSARLLTALAQGPNGIQCCDFRMFT